MKRQLAEAQENQALKEEKYSSLQQEVDVKSKKLKKLVTKLTEANNEIRDLQSEWQREKEGIFSSSFFLSFIPLLLPLSFLIPSFIIPLFLI